MLNVPLSKRCGIKLRKRRDVMKNYASQTERESADYAVVKASKETSVAQATASTISWCILKQSNCLNIDIKCLFWRSGKNERSDSSLPLDIIQTALFPVGGGGGGGGGGGNT